MSSDRLQVLILEDRAEDAELLVRELKRSGLEVAHRVVQTEAEYLAELDRAPDLILADYSLPRFNALRALELLHGRGLDIPFIVVTGTIGEELAVECIKQGAADYLLKDRLGRLAAAVRAAVRQRQLRLQSLKAERDRSRLAAVLETTSDFVGIAEPDGKAIYANRAGRRMLGIRDDEALNGVTLPEFHPTWAADIVSREGIPIASRDGIWAGETALKHRAGHEIPVLQVILAHRAPGGTIEFISTVARDISDRKREEEVLRSVAEGTAAAVGEDSFRSLARHVAATLRCRYAMVAEFVRDRSERVRSLAFWQGDHFGDQLEYEVAGTPAQGLMGGQSCQFPRRVRKRFPQDPLLASLDVESYLGVPLISSSGGVIGHMSVMDIEPRSENRHEAMLMKIFATRAGAELERLRSEASVRASERRLRSLVENLPAGAVHVEGDLLFCNKATERITGYLRSEIPTVDAWFRLLYGAEQVSVRALYEEDRKAGFPVPRTVPVRRKDGQIRFVEFAAFRYEHGDVWLLTDVTERKRLEDQLLQSQKMEAVGRLAGGIAHDFNNLLTVILGYVKLTAQGLPHHDRKRGNLEQVEKAAVRAAELTGQLLTFARKQLIEPRVLDLNGLIINVDQMLRRLIGDEIDFVAVPAPDLWSVRVDPGQFEQVIVNLAVNARDAMPDGGRLTLETANVLLTDEDAKLRPEVVPGPYVLLTVSDTGLGMSEDTRARIFEPFFTTKELGKGTGLGLASCYGMVKQAGGYIWVYSGPGRGATFRIYLPRVEDGQDGRVSAALGRVGSGGETILLVEDEPLVRDLVAQTLRAEGYTVMAAMAGDEALIIARQHPGDIHLLLTDVVLPRMNPKELTERLRADRPGVKVLYVSGYAETLVVREGVLGPGVAFLPKPFTPPMLIKRVREVLAGV